MTGDQRWEDAGDGADALATLAPGPASLLGELSSATPVPPGWTDALRSAMARVHGLTPLGADVARRPTAVDIAPAVGAFATAFATDVSTIDDDLRSRFLDSVGDEAFAVVQTVYLADLIPRVRAALDACFGLGPWTVSDRHAAVGPGDLWATIERFMVEVNRLESLDAVTSEVVRLRGARQHRCRLCQSLRSRPALLAGGDDGLWAAIDRPDTLSDPRHRAAVAVVDTMVWTPARWSLSTIEQVRSTFTPAQAVELVLDVMRNAANKIAVALAADDPHVTEGVEVYEVDRDGVPRYGLDTGGW